jgi:hypothetical protein
MKTQQEIETFLAAQMHGTWAHLDRMAQLACTLAYAIGDRNGYEEGYEAGFQVGCASERGLTALQKKFNEIDRYASIDTAPPAPAPTDTDLVDTSNSDKAGDGEVHPVFSDAFKVIGQ